MNDQVVKTNLRKKIGIRFLYTILYLILFEIVKCFIQLSTIFQFVYLFVTQKPCEPLRKFSNKAASYGYQLMRYATLNDSFRPFPFSDFPAEKEASEEPVRFD